MSASSIAAPATTEIEIQRTATNKVVLTNSIQWSDLESTDYPTYIANLRRIGCPEKTIADIIVADVEELYERKRALVPLEARFWESDVQVWRAMQKRVDEQIRLEDEKTALLRQLLNIIWFKHPKDSAHDVSIMQFFTGILNREKAAQLLARLERWKDDKELLDSACFSIHSPEDEGRKETLRENYRADIRGAVTPSEGEEMSLRGVVGDVLDRREIFSAVGVSAVESKQIAKLAVDAIPKQSQGTLPFDESVPEPHDLLATNQVFRAQLRQLLGASRYGLYELASADNFDAIYRSVQKHELPREVAFELARVAIAAETNAKQWRESSELPADVRAASLKGIRQELEQAMGGLVGTNRDSFFQENEGWLKRMEGTE